MNQRSDEFSKALLVGDSKTAIKLLLEEIADCGMTIKKGKIVRNKWHQKAQNDTNRTTKTRGKLSGNGVESQPDKSSD